MLKPSQNLDSINFCCNGMLYFLLSLGINELNNIPSQEFVLKLRLNCRQLLILAAIHPQLGSGLEECKSNSSLMEWYVRLTTVPLKDYQECINYSNHLLSIAVSSNASLNMFDEIKGVMQGKLIAVVYTLRTHWNQFSLGGICKQEWVHQCSFSIRGGLQHLILIILIIHILVSYDQNISLIFLCERWIPCQAVPSVLCLHYRPETAHCSTKDAYTSEITFLAL